MTTVFNTIAPVFTVIAIGYLLAARRELHLPTLSDLAILVTSPALVFSVLSGTELGADRWGVLAGGTVFIAAGAAVLAVGYLRTSGEGRRGLLLPAIFWNAGNITLPCAHLAFGQEGLEAAAIVFVTMAILTSTFGIWIAKGENGLEEALRLPLLYGGVGGMALAVTDTTLPRVVMEPIEMLGAMAIPIMLLNLGIQLRTLRLTDLMHSIAVIAIRMGGGVVFAQRYHRDPSLVASCIVLGTFASLVTIPALLYFVT
jgi:predicted permease